MNLQTIKYLRNSPSHTTNRHIETKHKIVHLILPMLRVKPNDLKGYLCLVLDQKL